jgi:RNA polymerase sigma-70 factor (ECF subfamily)
MQNDIGEEDLAIAVPIEAEVRSEVAVADEYLWVERAKLGHLDAFDLIMGRYEQRLLRFLTGLVGDRDLAQELCQDTFLAAYQALPRMSGEVRLSAWLHTIALNRARSHFRKWKLRKTLPIKDDLLQSREPDLQDATAMQELVQRILAQIPKQYSEALLLQITAGLSCREIGRAVGCSESAIKVRLMRAREAFKKVYENEVREPCKS